MYHTLSVSIVNYCTADDTVRAAKSILRHTIGVDFILYIIDNASNDGSVARLNGIEDSRVRVISGTQNKGYGGGHNSVLSLLQSEFHAVINPDILLVQDSLSMLCDFLKQNTDTVMVTPALEYSDKSPQYTPKRAPTLQAVISRQLKIMPQVEKHYLMLDENLDIARDITFCTGCFFVVKTEIFKEVGGFCKRYFLYFEDADLTRMMLEKGRVQYSPCTTVIHNWARRPHKSLWHFYLQLRSMFIYFSRWGHK